MNKLERLKKDVADAEAAYAAISEVLAESDFYSKDHQLIFSAMGRLAAEDQLELDLKALDDDLEEQGE